VDEQNEERRRGRPSGEAFCLTMSESLSADPDSTVSLLAERTVNIADETR